MTNTSAPQPPATPTGQPGQQPSGPQLRAISQFAKDLSFENPGNVPGEERPNIDLGIDVSATPHEQGNGIYEVSLKLSAKAHTTTTTLFLLELDYGGLFQVIGMSEKDAEVALLVECPRLLFPFARRLVADITREGGFPPLLIDPVDFVQLYQSQRQKPAGAPGAAQAPGPALRPPQAGAPVPSAQPQQPGQPPAAPAQPRPPGQPSFPPGTGQGS